jgi:hypothetical protein
MFKKSEIALGLLLLTARVASFPVRAEQSVARTQLHQCFQRGGVITHPIVRIYVHRPSCRLHLLL